MRHLVRVAAILLAACSGADEPVQLAQPGYSIDRARITVSGISAGAYMAGQLHVAHSALFGGAALIAGGPYGCAQASMQTALGGCMDGSDLDVPALLAYAQDMQDRNRIDALDNLRDDRVWIFHGAEDEIVSEAVSEAAASFYAELIDVEAITLVTDQPVSHGFPTLENGVPCGELASPYLMACNYDAAGTLLRALYGELQPRTAASGDVLTIAQPGAEDAEMLDFAYLYVPRACAAGEACGLHVALHGCQQSAEFVDDAFATGAGYNEWADSNRLLVLYPQAAKSRVAPLNPLGCWDWWGYTGDDYATRDATQISAVRATIDALSSSTL